MISNGTPVEVFFLSNAFVSMMNVIRNGLDSTRLLFFFFSSFFLSVVQLLLHSCKNDAIAPLFLYKVLEHVFAHVCISGLLNPTGFLPFSIQLLC